MAKEDQIEEYRFDNRTADEQREIAIAGGKASGEVRRQKKTFKKAVEWLVNSDIKISDGSIKTIFEKMGVNVNNLNPTQLATIGLWVGAIQGNATNYKTLMEANEEIDNQPSETPTVNINIIDNSELEKALYEEDKL